MTEIVEDLSLTGFQVYSIWNALKLHFTSKSYDFFKYNGKTNVTKENFAIRKDRYTFHKLARKYNRNNIVSFFVSNLVQRNVSWVGELTTPEGEEIYKNWMKTNQSLSYIFEQDIQRLFGNCKKPNDLLVVISGEFPKLLDLLLEKEINLETFIILSDLINFLPDWNKKITEDVVWPELSFKYERYKPFVIYDRDKMNGILKKNLKEYF